MSKLIERANVIETYYREYFLHYNNLSIDTFILKINDLGDNEKMILKHLISTNLCKRHIINTCPDMTFLIGDDPLYHILAIKFASNGNDLFKDRSRPSTARIRKNGGFYKQKVVKVIRKY